jgi:hypothetical protein
MYTRESGGVLDGAQSVPSILKVVCADFGHGFQALREVRSQSTLSAARKSLRQVKALLKEQTLLKDAVHRSLLQGSALITECRRAHS